MVVLSETLASSEAFHRRIRGPFVGGKRLIWAIGSEASVLSRRMSAALSERGIPNRWVPLDQRPSFWQEALSRPWPETILAAFLRDLDVLVLSASERLLHALWCHLQGQNLICETVFVVGPLRSPLLRERLVLTQPAELAYWARLYEELARDLMLAQEWLPCRLTAYLP